MVSAVARSAIILLVEATSANMSDLGTAVNQAVAQGAKFVSNSYGGSEDSSDTSSDSSYFDHPGVAITASTGDSAYGAEYPATSQYVTAVGGTSLTRGGGSRGWTESVWYTSSSEGTGSGCSAYDPKPSWQHDTGCSTRMEADVSAVADPATGVAVYQTYGGSGWSVYGGTSAASPIVASVWALAGAPNAGDRRLSTRTTTPAASTTSPPAATAAARRPASAPRRQATTARPGGARRGTFYLFSLLWPSSCCLGVLHQRPGVAVAGFARRRMFSARVASISLFDFIICALRPHARHGRRRPRVLGQRSAASLHHAVGIEDELLRHAASNSA